MEPFLLLSIRADDAAADNEYESFRTLAGLSEGDLRRIRLDRRALGDIDLRDWSGIWVGGGPFNYTDPDEKKSPVQRRVEADLSRLLDDVVGVGFPFLGTCYGVGALGRHQGAVLDRRYSEPVGTVRVTLTAAGRRDPVLGELPAEFDAFTGHKEAVSELPEHAVLLATSAACPVQAFRVGAHVYATQFHPELDAAGLSHPGRRVQGRRLLRSEGGRRRSRRWPGAARSATRPRSCARSSGVTAGTEWGPRPGRGEAAGEGAGQRGRAVGRQVQQYRRGQAAGAFAQDR